MNKSFIIGCFGSRRGNILRKTFALSVLFVTVFAFCSCSGGNAAQTTVASTQPATVSQAAQQPEAPLSTRVYVTSPFQQKVDSGELKINEFGRYSGEYVEDGSNRPVENIAAIRVTNKSNKFLDFATVTVTVDNQPATFVITGLPAGKCAWVLEKSCLAISEKAAFEFIDCVTSFSEEDVVSTSDKVSISFDGNYMTVSNLSGEKLRDVAIYYRNKYEDGNYLGGITYRVSVGSINANEAATVIAGHYSEEKSEIVRIDF